MKSLNLLSLLALSGPVIKATPALPPHDVSIQRYNKFDVTLIEKYDDPDSYSGEGKTYKINVKNTGEGYLTFVGLYFPKENEDYRYSSYGFEPGFVSDNSVLAPNQEKEMIISANYDVDNINDFYIDGGAYVDFTDEVTVTTDYTITTRKTDYTSELYQYVNVVNMTFDKDNDRYCYGAIIKVNVEGEDYYFKVDLSNDFFFYTSIPLSDEEQAEFEIVKVLKTEYSHYKESKTNYGSLAFSLILVPVLITALFICLLAVIIIIAIRSHKND